MDRLQILDAGLRALDASLPGVTPPLCLATRYRASSCRRCLDVCSTDAIEPAPWLRLVPERCSSCGACAAVCPTGALAFAALSAAVRERLRAIADAGHDQAVLACRFAEVDEPGAEASEAERPDAGRDARSDGTTGRSDDARVVVACLGALSAAELIGAAAAGLDGLTLVSAGCEVCRDRAAGSAADGAVDTAVAAVAALGGRLGVRRRSAPRTVADGDGPGVPAGPALSRRDLFTYLARGARRTAAEGLASSRHTIGDLHAQAPPPARQGLLRADLAALATRDGAGCAAQVPSGPATLPAALPLADLEIGPGCTGCDLCVRYCPHGALAPTGAAPRCDGSLCTGCGLCVEVCPPSVLALRPATAKSLPATASGVP